MRFAKFLGVLLVAFVAGSAYAQTQPENGAQTPERPLTESVHLFPNPAVEYLHVKVDQFPANKVKLAVHNILGNEINIESEVVDEHELRIKVKDFSTGYYLLAIRHDESKFRASYKFLKR
jgi:hypothetical protein